MTTPVTLTDVDDHLVTLVRRSSPEAEQYNSLRYAIEKARGGAASQILAVTSPVVGDGKTTTAVNLAGVLAHRRDARVLLIDADLRCPAVPRVLGLSTSGQPGLVDVLQDSALSIDRVAIALPQFNLSVVTTGTFSDDPFELLRAPRAGDVLDDARRKYEFVILDCSPLLLVPDSQALEKWVDGFVLVVSAHGTPRKLVGDAVKLISSSKLIGTVFNRDDRRLSGYYGHYYGYGQRPSRPGGPSDDPPGARASQARV